MNNAISIVKKSKTNLLAQYNEKLLLSTNADKNADVRCQMLRRCKQRKIIYLIRFCMSSIEGS